MLSLIIPTAGLFRHNERLWPAIAAAARALTLELIIVTRSPMSPALEARLATFDSLRGRVKVVLEDRGGIGGMFAAGLNRAEGDQLVLWHDDLHAERLDRILVEFLEPGVMVPVLEVSSNREQERRGFAGKTITTRYVDRPCIKMDRFFYTTTAADLNLAEFQVDGYTTAIQVQAARMGLPVWVVDGGRMIHQGSATLGDLANTTLMAEMFKEDAGRIAGRLGVPLESGTRPGVPRVIVRGWMRPAEGEALPVSRGTLEEIVNAADCEWYVYNGRRQRRIQCGDRFTLPDALETYDILFSRATGIGDAVMHTSAIGAFKRRHPHTVIRVWAYSASLEIVRRCPYVAHTYDTRDHRPPSSCVVWDVANGMEGTADLGYRHLGLQEIPFEERRTYVQPFHVPNLQELTGKVRIGLQLGGGWKQKRYAHFRRLAKLLESELGATVYLFSRPRDVDPWKGWEDRDTTALTYSLDHLMGYQEQMHLWIGFDSGGSYLANAVGVPSILMFGSHNPEGLIGQCGANAPYKAIWPAWPARCASLHRITCRANLGVPNASPASCPLRKDAGGADCLDSITPEQILQDASRMLEIPLECR